MKESILLYDTRENRLTNMLQRHLEQLRSRDKVTEAIHMRHYHLAKSVQNSNLRRDWRDATGRSIAARHGLLNSKMAINQRTGAVADPYSIPIGEFEQHFQRRREHKAELESAELLKDIVLRQVEENPSNTVCFVWTPYLAQTRHGKKYCTMSNPDLLLADHYPIPGLEVNDSHNFIIEKLFT